MVGKRLIVTALLASILITARIGFVGRVSHGLAVSKFGGRMSFTLIGMLMLVAPLTLWVLRSREFEGVKRAVT